MFIMLYKVLVVLRFASVGEILYILSVTIQMKAFELYFPVVLYAMNLPTQSPRGFSALARLYYLATKTAMLRRLRTIECSW